MRVDAPALAEDPYAALRGFPGDGVRGRVSKKIEGHDAELKRIEIAAPPREERFSDSLARGVFDALPMDPFVGREIVAEAGRGPAPVKETLPVSRAAIKISPDNASVDTAWIHAGGDETPLGLSLKRQNRRQTVLGLSGDLVRELLHGESADGRGRVAKSVLGCEHRSCHVGARGRKAVGEIGFFRQEGGALNAALKRHDGAGFTRHGRDERLSDSVKPVRFCNADSELGSILSAI
jgi:hypothetical protein